MSASIPLRRRDGSIRAWAIIDSEDWDDLSRFRWRLIAGGYAARHHGKSIEYMHRRICELQPGDERQVDHKDLNRRNNQRSNLRVVPGDAANRQNVPSYRGSSSKHRGVSWYPRDGVWQARAQIDGRPYFLGRFADEEEAAEVVAAFRREHMPYSREAMAT